MNKTKIEHNINPNTSISLVIPMSSFKVNISLEANFSSQELADFFAALASSERGNVEPLVRILHPVQPPPPPPVPETKAEVEIQTEAPTPPASEPFVTPQVIQIYDLRQIPAEERNKYLKVKINNKLFRLKESTGEIYYADPTDSKDLLGKYGGRFDLKTRLLNKEKEPEWVNKQTLEVAIADSVSFEPGAAKALAKRIKSL